MKKNNSYITDDEIDLGDLLRTLWREKILILSISIIFDNYLFEKYIKIKVTNLKLFTKI
jgi:LPS O-antigen subunit length determinant protein (WzzB/FepE family)